VLEKPMRLPPSVEAEIALPREARPQEALPLRVLPMRALRELLDDDEDALREVLAKFRESLADVRAGVSTAIQIHDLGALAFHAHRFKSAAGQMDATESYRLCSLLNDLTRHGDPAVHPEAEALVRQLLAALDQLERDIEYTMGSLTT
jgi:HPt (histidine-containing phosphotransfer) domain-containing protein